MKVDEKTAKWTTTYKDKMYYFCGPICKEEFDSNPEKYVLQGLKNLQKQNKTMSANDFT
jgi:YHS domain-containing protein